MSSWGYPTIYRREETVSTTTASRVPRNPVFLVTRKVTKLKDKNNSLIRVPTWWLEYIGASERAQLLLLPDKVIIASPRALWKELTGKEPPA